MSVPDTDKHATQPLPVPADAAQIAAAPAADAQPSRAMLTWTEPSGEHGQLVLADVVRVGRALSADIRFEDATVSRRHALLKVSGDGRWHVHDDRSLNGVQVNDTRVEGSRPLQDGDQIRIGRHLLRYRDPQPAAAGTPTAALAVV